MSTSKTESGGKAGKRESGSGSHCLSIRQPWAWLIVNGHKDIENRSWFTHFRGRVLIHAGATMTKADYQACMLFIAGISRATGWRVPAYDVLRGQCGGIVGAAEIAGCVTRSDSPWFVGDYGFVLRNQKVLPFQPCKGALGFFPLPEGKDLGVAATTPYQQKALL